MTKMNLSEADSQMQKTDVWLCGVGAGGHRGWRGGLGVWD